MLHLRFGADVHVLDKGSDVGVVVMGVWECCAGGIEGCEGGIQCGTEAGDVVCNTVGEVCVLHKEGAVDGVVIEWVIGESLGGEIFVHEASAVLNFAA